MVFCCKLSRELLIVNLMKDRYPPLMPKLLKDFCALRRSLNYDPYNKLPPPSIILIIVWLGPWPFWMSAFLHSCSFNQDVDWLIVCNVPAPDLPLPKNVRFKVVKISKISKLASTALGFNCSLISTFGYKLCDYKPAYGIIFESDITGYDYWGHCDLDIVWGNIRAFLTPEILLDNEIISSRARQISGHFTIYRNNTKINNLFRYIPNYSELLKISDQHMYIDEALFSNVIDQLAWFPWYPKLYKIFLPNLYLAWKAWLSWYSKNKGGLTKPCKIPWGIIMLGGFHPRVSVYWHRELTTSRRMQQSVDAHRCLIWNNGRTYCPDGSELMYLHFHTLKHASGFKNYFEGNRVPSRFVLNYHGFTTS